MIFLVDLLAATLRNATPLVYGAVGETYAERSGVLNLGIEGTMYAGAFTGFAVAYSTGSLLLGLAAAIVVGLLAGALMALLTVTLGANQHVSGIGLTILLIGLSEFTNRLMFGGTEVQRIDPFPQLEAPAVLGPLAPLFTQYALTWLAFLVVVPGAWWLLNRSSFGLEIRAVGENPEAADAAGVRVTRTRYLALMLGRRAHGDRGFVLHARPARQLHARHHRGPGLGGHRPGDLRAVADHAGRRGGPDLRGGLFAAVSAAHPARLGRRPVRAPPRAAIPGRHRGPRHLGSQRRVSRGLPQAVSSELNRYD